MGNNIEWWAQCCECPWEGYLKDTDTDYEYDPFKGIDRPYPICPKCEGGIETSTI